MEGNPCQYRVKVGIFNNRKFVTNWSYNYLCKDLGLSAYPQLFPHVIVLFSLFFYVTINQRKCFKNCHKIILFGIFCYFILFIILFYF